MNAEVKQKWLTALRSGKYTQTRKVLRNSGNESDLPIGYCCLGVLCELYRKETGNGEWNETTFKCNGTYAFGVLHSEVSSWAELEFTNPIVEENHIKVNLANLNDAGLDFKQIADIIENQL